MHSKCPRCKTFISASLFKREFDCPQCRSRLSGEWIGPLVVFLLAWLAAGFASTLLLDAVAPSRDAIPPVLQLLLLVVIGWGLFMTVFQRLCSVRARPADS